jgi:hypothetical protein
MTRTAKTSNDGFALFARYLRLDRKDRALFCEKLIQHELTVKKSPFRQALQEFLDETLKARLSTIQAHAFAAMEKAATLQAIAEAQRDRLRLFFPEENAALTDAIIRLRDNRLPNGRRRAWKQVRKELRVINPAWNFPKDDTVRVRYQRAKKSPHI